MSTFDYKHGCFRSRKEAAEQRERFINEFVMPPRSTFIEGKPGEYRIYFPLTKRYFWPISEADWNPEEERLVSEYRSYWADE